MADVALIVANSEVLSAHDTHVQGLITAEGHTPVIRDDGLTTALAEVAAVINEGSSVDTAWAKALTKPVVAIDHSIWIALGLSTGETARGGQNATILLPGHALAGGLSGTVQVNTNDGSYLRRGATDAELGAGATAVAKHDSQLENFVVEYLAGATLADASTAAGWRCLHGVASGSTYPSFAVANGDALIRAAIAEAVSRSVESHTVSSLPQMYVLTDGLRTHGLAMSVMLPGEVEHDLGMLVAGGGQVQHGLGMRVSRQLSLSHTLGMLVRVPRSTSHGVSMEVVIRGGRDLHVDYGDPQQSEALHVLYGRPEE